jgi:hypothetical protein
MLLQAQIQAPGQLSVDPSPDPGSHNGQEPHRGNAEFFQERPTRSPLPGRHDGFAEAPYDHNGSLIEGLAIVGVEVTLEDPERIDPIDQDFHTLGRLYDLDGARSALGQNLTNALVRCLRARRRRVADVRSPEGDDVSIEEAERGRPRSRLGGSGRHTGRLCRR